MPELPEVETIRTDLDKHLRGRKIIGIKIPDGRVIKHPSPKIFKKRLTGDSFLNVKRRAKFLLLPLRSGSLLLVHLGMAAWLRYFKGRPSKYCRVLFKLDNGRYLEFGDKRIFGKLRLLSRPEDHPGLGLLGPEPLSKDFSLVWFKKALSKRKTKIKALLLNQNFIAGIGNIYAQEALFRAGIHPERRANQLRGGEIKKLHLAIRRVLKEGISHRGTSVDSYVDGFGRKGSFQFRLRVYGRENEACLRCRTPIKKKTIGQRGTYFCPGCQK